MKNNVLKALSNNLIFKILAVIFAFTLWLVVYNMEDPTKTDTMTLQVSLINKESVESLNKYFEVTDGGKVTFSVTAPRSVLDKLDETDFAAVADMEYLTISEDGESGTVPIDIRCISSNMAEAVKLSTTTKTLRVKLEDLMSKQFIITANAVGKVAEGHALGTVSVTAPNVIKISGPESIVKTVASVVATIDVDDMSMTVTDSVVPVLYDSEGNEIDTTRLTLSNTTVNVSANILKTKEVPISLKPSGDTGRGYVVTSIISDPTTILIKGSTAVLNTINVIEIPSELVSVEDAISDVFASIDIAEYLPYGVELVDKNDSTVNITVTIGKIREKVYSVATENIIVTGLPTNTKFKFIHSSIAVRISGLEEDINLLSSDAISGSIDVTGLPDGEHQLTLILDIDGAKYIYNEVKVAVFIGEEPVADPGTENTGTENPNNTEDPDNTEVSGNPSNTEDLENTENPGDTQTSGNADNS